jgi:hypothetical protein
MARNITAAQAADKWAGVTSSRTTAYQQGVANPRRPWAETTAAAADAYKAGVTESIAKGTFQKGVAATGNAGYQKATMEKGPQRFAEGVTLGQNAYASKIAPVLATIAGTQLPPRYAKGDPRNIDRVKAITTALRKMAKG